MNATNTSNRCPTCLNSLRDRAKFCPVCGTKLVAQPAAKPTAPAKTPAVTKARASSGGGGFGVLLFLALMVGRAYVAYHHPTPRTPPSPALDPAAVAKFTSPQNFSQSLTVPLWSDRLQTLGSQPKTATSNPFRPSVGLPPAHDGLLTPRSNGYVPTRPAGGTAAFVNGLGR